MADTVRDLITEALTDIGVLADGETPSASQAQGALRKLNSMLEAWNIENLMNYGQTGYVLPTVSNQGVYTIGTGGNLNIPRPDKINYATVRDNNNTANQMDYPLYIYSDQEWAELPFKNMTGLWPAYGIYFNYTYPLIQAYLNPIPTSTQYRIVLWVDGGFDTLTLDSLIAFAPGYRRCMVSNLSVELSPSYGADISEIIVKIAQDSKARLKINNYRPTRLVIDSELTNSNYFDYRIG